MLKVYVAGSLFNEAEVAQRKAEGSCYEENFRAGYFQSDRSAFNEKQASPADTGNDL